MTFQKIHRYKCWHILHEQRRFPVCFGSEWLQNNSPKIPTSRNLTKSSGKYPGRSRHTEASLPLNNWPMKKDSSVVLWQGPSKVSPLSQHIQFVQIRTEQQTVSLTLKRSMSRVIRKAKLSRWTPSFKMLPKTSILIEEAFVFPSFVFVLKLTNSNKILFKTFAVLR